MTYGSRNSNEYSMQFVHYLLSFGFNSAISIVNIVCTCSAQSACGVCIRTGSYCDPPEVAGLAHLLEHSELLSPDSTVHIPSVCIVEGISVQYMRLLQ